MRPTFDPFNDYAFKRIFGHEENSSLLISLQNAIFYQASLAEITDVEYLNPINEAPDFHNKSSILDIKVLDNLGRRIGVEMQRIKHPGFEKRIGFYLSTLYTQQFKKGGKYQDILPAISICLATFRPFQATYDNSIFTFELHDPISSKSLSRDLLLILVPLRKKVKIEDIANMLDVWLYFFNNANELDSENLPAKLDKPEIRKALEELCMISKDEIERELYLSRERRLADELSLQDYAENAREYGLAEGKEIGIAEGKEIGIAEGKEIGKDEGELIGIIRTCEKILGIPVTSREDLYGLQIDDLRARVNELQSKLDLQ